MSPRRRPQRGEALVGFACWSNGERIRRFFGAGECLEESVSEDGVRWRSGRTLATAPDSLPTWAEAPGGEVSLLTWSVKGAPCFRWVSEDAVTPLLELGGEWYVTSKSRAVWRDPTLVDAEGGGGRRLFWSARAVEGFVDGERGCIGAAVSNEGGEWEIEVPAYAPGAYAEMRWPHVYVEPGAAQMLFTTFGGDRAPEIRYARGGALEGPYFKPPEDLVCRDRRLLVQTVPFHGERVAFFLCRAGAGLRVSRPVRVASGEAGRPRFLFFDPLLTLRRKPILDTSAVIEEKELLVRVLPCHTRDVVFDAEIESAGPAAALVVRTNPTGKENLAIWLDFRRRRVIVRRGVKGRILGAAPAALAAGDRTRARVWVEGDLLSVYVAGELVLVAAVEGRPSGGLGIAAEAGRVEFRGLSAWPLGGPPE